MFWKIWTRNSLKITENLTVHNMEYWDKASAWFTSPEGITAYASLPSLMDKTLFFYAYLQKKLHKSYETDNACFKFALFLADAVANSSLSFSSYPEILDASNNPYLAYMVNWDKYPGKRVLYYGFMSVLHGLADPALRPSWIYDKELMGSDALQSKLLELDRNFYDEDATLMPNPLAYDIEDDLSDFQLKLRWFFDKK